MAKSLLGGFVDPEDVPGGIREHEPPAARIVVHRELDPATRRQHAGQGRVGIVGADQRQHPSPRDATGSVLRPPNSPPVLGSLMPA